MQYKRAIGIGVAAYFVSFILGIVIAVALGIDLSSPDAVTNSMWFSGIIAQIFVALIFAYWYFSGKKVESYGIKEGLNLALVFVLVGFAIDLLFMLPLMVVDGMGSEIWNLYSHPLFWISILVLFLGCVFVGSLFEDKRQLVE